MAEKKINGREFRCESMLATEAVLLKFKLMKVLGGGIDRLPEIFAGSGSADADVKAKSDAAAIAAFSDIFAKNDPEEMMELVKSLAEVAQIKRPSGQYDKVDMDGDFSGELASLFQLVVFVLQVQFGPFFKEILKNGGRVLKV